MSVKFDYTPYKLFEPQYHTQRPIIIDADAIESPETVTLRYEEEAAARANGGGLRGYSPPGLLGIDGCQKSEPPPMHSFESPRAYHQDPQYQYAGQSFTAQQTENAAAAQLNHMAFAANNSASQYMSSVVPTLTSYQPTSGVFGTKVMIKISAPYDLMAVSSQFVLAFGPHRSPAHAVRDASDPSGLGYVVSGDAPQPDDTRIPGESVPISLLIESADGQALANVDVGTFTYHDAQAMGAEGSHEDITRRPSSKSHEEGEHRQPHGASPSRHAKQEADQLSEAAGVATNTYPRHAKQEADQLSEAAGVATNTYPYAPTTHQAVASNYDAAEAYPGANNSSMLSTYHRPTYGADYPRPPALLKGPSWAGAYGPSLTSPHSPPGHRNGGGMARSVAGALPMPIPTSNTPRLARTSTIQASNSVPGAPLNPHVLYAPKAVLKINGDLEAMANNWTPEECDNGRRLVLFSKKQQGSTVSMSFKPVSVSERPPNGICISCIYWKEKRECFVTSVDTIALLEQLVSAPVRFQVDEKNRIRRNLEGFRPMTVSKQKPDSGEFFRMIMAFPNPKPRNIEKDVKVFPWKILAPALKKIVSKYSASPPSPGPHHQPPPYHHPSPGPLSLLTPVSSTSPGLYVSPHTPTLGGDSVGYGHHHDAQAAMASPRSLSGAPSTWAPYTATTAAGSNNGIKSQSPQAGGMRTPSLPSYANHGYTMASHGHRWDANGYGDASAAPAYPSHGHPSHVYGSGGYGGSGHHHRE